MSDDDNAFIERALSQESKRNVTVKKRRNLIIDGCELVMTCGFSPEQYDVCKNGKIVGYLRLRDGLFRADVPCCGGETVYSAETTGTYMFERYERLKHLRKAVKAIAEAWERGKVPLMPCWMMEQAPTLGSKPKTTTRRPRRAGKEDALGGPDAPPATPDKPV